MNPDPWMITYGLVLLSIVAFDVVAVVLLNGADSRKWFKRRGQFGGIDPETFD
jgi:hypothetical protein